MAGNIRRSRRSGRHLHHIARVRIGDRTVRRIGGAHLAGFLAVSLAAFRRISGLRRLVQFRLRRVCRGPAALSFIAGRCRRARIPRWHAWRHHVGTRHPPHSAFDAGGKRGRLVGNRTKRRPRRSGDFCGRGNFIVSELDELFRNDRPAVDVNQLAYRRAEAARILLKTSSSQGVTADDRNYLMAIVAAEIGGADPAYVQSRVDRVIGKSASAIHKARQAAVLQAFLVAAALILGAAVSWFAAAEGGRDRERNSYPVWNWSIRPRTI